MKMQLWKNCMDFKTICTKINLPFNLIFHGLLEVSWQMCLDNKTLSQFQKNTHSHLRGHSPRRADFEVLTHWEGASLTMSLCVQLSIKQLAFTDHYCVPDSHGHWGHSHCPMYTGQRECKWDRKDIHNPLLSHFTLMSGVEVGLTVFYGQTLKWGPKTDSNS